MLTSVELQNSLSFSTVLGPGLRGKGEWSTNTAFGKDTGVATLIQAGFFPRKLAHSSPEPLAPLSNQGCVPVLPLLPTPVMYQEHWIAAWATIQENTAGAARTSILSVPTQLM